MKEKTEPINVRVSLKNFLEKKKSELKSESGKFCGMTETLMHYLEDSKAFINDYNKYNGVEKIDAQKILDFIDDDLLGLLIKK